MNRAQYATNAAGIGALEIKRAYQRNMFLSVILASGTALILMSGMLLHAALQPAPQASPRVRKPSIYNHVRPIPSWNPRPKLTTGSAQKVMPVIGIPVPVAYETEERIVYPAPRPPSGSGFSTGGGYGGDPEGYSDAPELYVPPPVFLPKPEDLPDCEQMPLPVYAEQPVYPEIAERVGIAGRVWVRALVDQDGLVIRAIILKASGTSAGFEEAALEAALKNRYRPALQNGRPVSVWISYKVDFLLQ